MTRRRRVGALERRQRVDAGLPVGIPAEPPPEALELLCGELARNGYPDEPSGPLTSWEAAARARRPNLTPEELAGLVARLLANPRIGERHKVGLVEGILSAPGTAEEYKPKLRELLGN